MDIQEVISQIVVLFILLAVGYAAGKASVLTPDTGKVLTKLLLRITMPCTILSTVIGGDVTISGGETAYFMLMVLLAFAIYFLIALPAARALGGDKTNIGLHGFMVVFGNVGFMGFPMAQAIFGPESAFYVALFNIIFVILIFSVGIVMVSGKGGKLDPRVLMTPTFFASLLVIPIAITGFRAPTVIDGAIRLIGSVTTPCSMLIIGITMSQISIKDAFSEWRLYPIAFLKLIVIPIVTWLVLRQFVTNELVLGVLTLLSAMPTAAMAAMFAIEYKGNEHIASSGIFLTTLISGATIPLIMFLLL